ncbi:MAG: 50S ribosomal protein L18 [Chitinivibrionales bacterium]|nr:50S ribosomal protein L18 [Chitinivibrionales bacterium]
MDQAKKRIVERSRRASRIREKIMGTAERPRLCVYRSLKHVYAQIVDDLKGASLVQVSSCSKEIKAAIAGKKESKKIDASKLIGEAIAAKAKEKGIEKVVFDRKGYQYHGRVKAIADAARSKGLKF